ncbi:MAG TPA: OsmC family protein [Gemmatimonadales bacterium]|nr:OsmC family protein [Gemmatimonadales bacterium]
MAGNVAEITMRWREGEQGSLVFEAAAPGRPPVVVDGDTKVATSPAEMLLVAAATCSASDVVLILQKQRVTLRGLEVIARGTRRAEQPRRYTALHFVFTITGDDVDEAKARRAVDLSLEKYCSVVASLATDIRVTYDVSLR